VADWSNSKMRWYDAADAKAWPIGLAVFLLAAVTFRVAGLGWWSSLLTAFGFGCAALNVAAGGARARQRKRRRS